MPRTNTVNEKWEIPPSLTNGVFCWVRRLWSQHISVTFSPPQPHLPRPLQFVGKRKKGLKSSKTNCGTIQKVLERADHTSVSCSSYLSPAEKNDKYWFAEGACFVGVVWRKRKGLERSSTKSFYKTIKLPRNSDPSVWKREYYNDNTHYTTVQYDLILK